MNVQNGIPRDVAAGEEGESFARTDATNFSLLYFLGILRTRWRLIAAVVAVVNALIIVTLFQLTPIYTANAVVMLDQRKNNVADLNAVLSGLPTDPSSIENQVQILTSRDLATRVIERLDLTHDPEFAGLQTGWLDLLTAMIPQAWRPQQSAAALAAAKSKLENKVITAFNKRLEVSPIGLSTAITVSFESIDPSKAARVTNAIADEYVEDQLNAKFEATQKATQWLSTASRSFRSKSRPRKRRCSNTRRS